MRLIVTPKLEASLADHPMLWQDIQDWRFDVAQFLDGIWCSKHKRN